MSYLILAHLDDETALLSAAALRRLHGQESVEVISPEALAMAPRWLHTLTEASKASTPGGLQVSTEITLASGRSLTEEGLKVVFNRLRWADPPHFASALAVDREYASAEMSALWVSWLVGLQAQGIRVINPPGQGGLQPTTNRLEWLKVAAQAGLPVAEIYVRRRGSVEFDNEADQSRHDDTQSINQPKRPAPTIVLAAGEWIVPLNQYIHGEVTEKNFLIEELEGKINLLQERSGCRLLELLFTLVSGGAGGQLADNPAWSLVAVNPFPVLTARLGIEAIARMLEEAGR